MTNIKLIRLILVFKGLTEGKAAPDAHLPDVLALLSNKLKTASFAEC
jgi:hypothetical protein